MIVFYTILFSTFVGLLFTYFNLLLLIGKERERKELKEYPKVSIIVPAYNEEENIAETIESLLNLDYPSDKLEIIVVDDGSKDRTYEIAKEYEKKYPNVKVFKKPNGGKASALNFGLEHATGDYIVTLDADSIVPKDALKRMLQYFTDDEVMIVVPAIQVKRKKNIIEKIQFIEYSYNNTLRDIFDRLNSIYVAPGPFSIFKRELFEKIGKFDENNLTEDMEIALRAQYYGYKIRYCPEVVIKTKAPQTFKQLLKQRIRWYLGFLENYMKYKNIRNFALREIVFASAWLFIFLPIALLIINFYFNIKGFYKTLEYYSSIDFDILPEIIYNIKYFNIDFDILRTSYFSHGLWLTFLGLIMMIIFIILINHAWRFEKEKNIPALIAYSFLYSLVYATFWLGVFYYKLFGKELKWGGVRWRNSLINKILNRR